MTMRSASPGDQEFKNLKKQYSNFDIRKVYKF